MLDKIKTLTPEIVQIVCDKGTEKPFTGAYTNNTHSGTYLCRRCGLALFRSDAQFVSTCGWPSFDDELSHTIQHSPDADGQRTEILCHRCAAHLGHIFIGEHYTKKNKRYCVNSLSVDFVENLSILDSEEALFAAGCFWGVEHAFQTQHGVLNTEVGYTGGHTNHPTYQMVCQGNTGHVETVRVLFDPLQVTYEELTQLFFEIHDPTQTDGQRPDIGPQYMSMIFYLNTQQANTAQHLMDILTAQGMNVATTLSAAGIFWPAETEHQDYVLHHPTHHLCHQRVKRFS